MFSQRQQTTIDQYLAQYSEPDGAEITLNRQYAQVLVIPAYSEGPATLTRLWAEMPSDSLLILVINAPAHDLRTRKLQAHFDARCVHPGPSARWQTML